MEFSPTLLAIVPPLLAILLAVITRQVVLSLFIAVFVGAVMLCGGNLWEGFQRPSSITSSPASRIPTTSASWR